MGWGNFGVGHTHMCQSKTRQHKHPYECRRLRLCHLCCWPSCRRRSTTVCRAWEGPTNDEGGQCQAPIPRPGEVVPHTSGEGPPWALPRALPWALPAGPSPARRRCGGGRGSAGRRAGRRTPPRRTGRAGQTPGRHQRCAGAGALLSGGLWRLQSLAKSPNGVHLCMALKNDDHPSRHTDTHSRSF